VNLLILLKFQVLLSLFEVLNAFLINIKAKMCQTV